MSAQLSGWKLQPDDNELRVTRERITYFLDLLPRLRVSARPDEFTLVAGDYRADVERMQREELDYLMRHVAPAKAGNRWVRRWPWVSWPPSSKPM